MIFFQGIVRFSDFPESNKKIESLCNQLFQAQQSKAKVSKNLQSQIMCSVVTTRASLSFTRGNTAYTPKVYAPPRGDYYTEVHIPPVCDNAKMNNIMSRIVGKNGSVFKAITHNSNASYIWSRNIPAPYLYNVIEIWGPTESSIVMAKQRIEDRVNTIIEQHVYE